MKRNNMLFAAAVAGGLYWASKQPGGISGTWSRVSDKLKKIQDSPDPLGAIKQQLSEARFGNSNSNELYQPVSGLNVPAPMDLPPAQSVSSQTI